MGAPDRDCPVNAVPGPRPVAAVNDELRNEFEAGDRPWEMAASSTLEPETGRTSMKNLLKAGVTLLALTAAWAMPASAETLRIGDSFPVGHYISENMTKVWMEEVKKASNGEVDFEYFPAEQLGKAKDLLSLTQSGVMDIGYVGASYVSDKLPLSSVGEMPEAFTTSCQGTKAFWQIAKPGGALDQAEFAPNGVRVLMVMVLPPYQVFTSNREISGLDSLKGLKIRSTGGA